MIATLVAAASLVAAPTDAPGRAPTELFALIVGVNDGSALSLPALRYADDDAARYFDLFQLLGARTYLLTRPDDNTRRLHPHAAGEAKEPVLDNFAAQTRQLQRDVAEARARGATPIVYFVYSGHGHVREGLGVISLEDAALTGRQLHTQLIRDVAAEGFHFIVDACHSYFLAYSRGPGGTRRQLPLAATASALADDPRVGLLLSTSSARESHEWEQFQSGVFAHEVRSGLLGAADVDGDAQVTYREIAAFVNHANAAVPNERFRPDVHARPPHGVEALLDLRRALAHRLDVDGSHAGHYVLEDVNGVRLAEFHSASSTAVRLARPPGKPLYLRRVASEVDFLIPATTEVVNAEQLVARPQVAATRGSATDAFSKVFALPLDRRTVETFRFPDLPDVDKEAALALEAGPKRLRQWGWITLGAGVSALGAAAFSTHQAQVTRSETGPLAHAEIVRRNEQIGLLNTVAIVSSVAGSAAALTGTWLLLAGHGVVPSLVFASSDGAGVSFSGSF